MDKDLVLIYLVDYILSVEYDYIVSRSGMVGRIAYGTLRNS